MAHGDAREGKWRGNWRMEWVASTLHTTSEYGASSVTTADAHTSVASSRLNWRPLRFKWTRPFRRKTKSGFCAWAITFQTQSTTDRVRLQTNCRTNRGRYKRVQLHLLVFLQTQHDEICTQQLVCTAMYLCQRGHNTLLRQDVNKKNVLASFHLHGISYKVHQNWTRDPRVRNQRLIASAMSSTTQLLYRSVAHRQKAILQHIILCTNRATMRDSSLFSAIREHGQVYPSKHDVMRKWNCN
jgi:hypothetical protein